MLTPTKKQKLLSSLKIYRKKYLDGNIAELDESGTRLMINSFLSDVLGYRPLEEIKTEYMIKDTYADYVIQVNGTRHFLVEVKALSYSLSEKHLRQTINYGANEGIDYALLTNGRDFEFYKIIFDKPIDARKMFAFDLSDISTLKVASDFLQHLHRESTTKNRFKSLWNKCEATDPLNIAGILTSDDVLTTIKKLIKNKYGEKCNEIEIQKAIFKIITEKIDPAQIRPFKNTRAKSKRLKLIKNAGPSLSELKVSNEQEVIIYENPVSEAES